MSEKRMTQSSINACYEMIVYADRQGAMTIKGGPHFASLKTHKMTYSKALEIFNGHWSKLNWNSEEDFKSISPYLIRAYYLTPKTSHSPHRHLEAELKKIGYRIPPMERLHDYFNLFEVIQLDRIT